MSITETPSAIDVEEMCARVRPTIERVLRSKFRPGRASVETQDHADFEELLLRVQRLFANAYRSGKVTSSPEGYAVTISDNEFSQYLKQKYKSRYELRDEIEKTIKLDPRLAFWTKSYCRVCGRVKWLGHGVVFNLRAELSLRLPQEASRKCYRDRDPLEYNMSNVLLEYFDWLGGPQAFERTVDFIAVARKIEDTTTVSLDGELFEPQSPYLDPEQELLEAEAAKEGPLFSARLLQSLWKEFEKLNDPVRSGIYLLRDRQQAHAIFYYLVRFRVATIAQIAEVCGLDLDQIAALLKHQSVSLKLLADVYSIKYKDAKKIERGIQQLLERRLKDYESEARR